MRLWTLHPRYLDAKGLVTLWREALLAQAVLRGRTTGYRHHPQLARFKACGARCSAINAYLAVILEEARSRGYAFDASKVGPLRRPVTIPCTDEQVRYEWAHLLEKLRIRHPALYRRLRDEAHPEVHPMFTVGPGPVEPWERPREEGHNPGSRRG